MNLPLAKEATVAASGTEEKKVQSVPDSKSAVSSLPLVPLIKNISPSQGMSLALLVFIGVLFVVDSLIIFRKRHTRAGSHSFAHASMILLLIILTLLYGKGAIL